MCNLLEWLESHWSVVVFVSSFLIDMISIGIPFMVGLYIVEFLKYFGESRSTTAWISSINIAFVLGGGPIVAIFLKWYTHRQITCAGILLTTVGFIACYFATSILQLCIFYGVFVGFGFAMTYFCSTIILGHYFDKYRSIITSSASVGGWIGMTMLPSIFSKVLEVYTWRGAMLIMAAFNLQALVFAALLREPTRGDKKVPKSVSIEVDDPKVEAAADSGSCRGQTIEIKPQLDCEKEQKSASHMENIDVTVESEHLVSVSDEYQDCERSNTSPSPSNANIYPKIVKYTSHVVADDTREQLNENITPQVDETNDEYSVKTNILSDVLRVVLDFKVCVYFINNIFWNIGSVMILIFTPDYLMQVGGMELDVAATVINMYGVGGIFGAIFAGILGNMKRFDVVIVYAVFCSLMGVVSFLYLLSVDYAAVIVISALFGLFFGGMVGLLIVVSTELMGDVRLLGITFGYIMFSNGIGNLIGPPLGGYLIDKSGGYTATFCVAGAVNTLSGLVMLLIPARTRFIQRGQRGATCDSH